MRIWKSVAACVLCAAVTVPAAGCKVNPDKMMVSGASQFAEGKEEEDYSPVNSGALLQKLIDRYTGAMENPDPKPMSDDEFQKLQKKIQTQTQPPTTAPVEEESEPSTEPPATEPAPPDTYTVGDYEDFKAMLLQAYTNTDEVITCTLTGSYAVKADDYQLAHEELRRDYSIETCCVERWSWYQQGSTYTVQISYSLPTEDVKRLKTETDRLAKEAVAKIDTEGKTEREIVAQVNDYLCDLVTYTAGSSPFPPLSYTAYGAFADGDAVCEGYTRAAKLMLNALGIKALHVHGECTNGELHAWNLVNVDGAWYHLDVTWNDSSRSREDYFLVSDDYMHVSRDWNAGLYPAANA